MRNEITGMNEVVPISPPDAATLANYKKVAALESSGSYIIFSKKGEWLDRESENIVGTLWMVEMSSIVAGARKWADRQVAAADFDLVCNGAKVPERDALGDNDTSRWGLNGDPWQRGFLLRMTNNEGAVVVWAAMSNGGRQAVGDLIEVWANRCERGRGGWPVVQLAAGGYVHKTYGWTDTPKLIVKSWTDEAAPPAAPSVPIASGPKQLAEVAKKAVENRDPNERQVAPLEADDIPF
jgi:hypothetical protein